MSNALDQRKSFTHQKPFTVDDVWIKAFTRHKKRFGCALCGHEFKDGDVARWVYAGGSGLCNFFVCPTCDGEKVIERAIENYKAAVLAAKRWNIYGPEWQ